MNKEYQYTTGGFPMSENRLDDLQEQSKFLENICLALGDTVILTGCVEAGGVVSSGIVAINGKLYPFPGGAVGTNVIITSSVTQTLPYQDGSKDYKTEHQAVFGTGSPQYAWSGFVRLDTLKNLTVWKNADDTATSSFAVDGTNWVGDGDNASSLVFVVSRHNKTVTMQGNLRLEGNPSTLVGTLPIGYRPGRRTFKKVVATITHSGTPGSFIDCVLEIKQNGEIYVTGTLSPATTPDMTIVYTSGVTFSTVTF